MNKSINKSAKNYAVIAVDAKNNYKVAKTLLEKGINVLMEKPPGLSTNEAEKLSRQAGIGADFLAEETKFLISSIEVYVKALKKAGI